LICFKNEKTIKPRNPKLQGIIFMLVEPLFREVVFMRVGTDRDYSYLSKNLDLLWEGACAARYLHLIGSKDFMIVIRRVLFD